MNKVINIEITNLEKILFPKDNITKGTVVEYYGKIAPYLLPHVKGHLITMQRYPDGIGQDGFFQKQVPEYFPAWINRHEVLLKNSENQMLVLLEKQEDLVYLANQAVIVYHSWLSSVKNIYCPDKIVFDLDPSVQDFKKLHFAAHELKKLLENYNLSPFIMTTGSRGYHVVVPIIAQYEFERVHEFAKKIATEIALQHSHILTVSIKKDLRDDKIFVDYLRNSYGQTSVAPYSLKAKDGAPIAVPINWEELDYTEPQKYNIKNIFKRIDSIEDPWKNFNKNAKKLIVD